MSSQRGLIAARAYELWKQRGDPEGSPEGDWLQAEKDVLGSADDDPSKPEATLDSLQQEVADVLTAGSDRGPTDTDTKKTANDGRSRSRRAKSRTK